MTESRLGARKGKERHLSSDLKGTKKKTDGGEGARQEKVKENLLVGTLCVK